MKGPLSGGVLINKLFQGPILSDGAATGPILNTAPALDMGYARNGETITRTQGSYSARGGGVITITVSEFRVDNVQVATGASYTPDGADEGLVLTYVETATEAGGTADGTRTTVIDLGAVQAAVGLPVASNLTATVIDETSASLTVDTNKGDGDVFAVAINTATGTYPPNVAQIIAGTDGADAAAAWDHNQGISASGTQTFAGGMTGLTEGQTYRAYAVYRDSSMNVSAVVATGDFVPADVTPPVLTSLDLAEVGTDDWSGTVQTDTGEGEIDLVITTSSTKPSVAQIKAGQDHTGAAAADSIIDQVVAAAGQQTFTGSGALSPSTEYWGHAVQTDASGNVSDVLSTVAGFTTENVAAQSWTNASTGDGWNDGFSSTGGTFVGLRSSGSGLGRAYSDSFVPVTVGNPVTVEVVVGAATTTGNVHVTLSFLGNSRSSAEIISVTGGGTFTFDLTPTSGSSPYSILFTQYGTGNLYIDSVRLV